LWYFGPRRHLATLCRLRTTCSLTRSRLMSSHCRPGSSERRRPAWTATMTRAPFSGSAAQDSSRLTSSAFSARISKCSTFGGRTSEFTCCRVGPTSCFHPSRTTIRAGGQPPKVPAGDPAEVDDACFVRRSRQVGLIILVTAHSRRVLLRVYLLSAPPSP